MYLQPWFASADLLIKQKQWRTQWGEREVVAPSGTFRGAAFWNNQKKFWLSKKMPVSLHQYGLVFVPLTFTAAEMIYLQGAAKMLTCSERHLGLLPVRHWADVTIMVGFWVSTRYVCWYTIYRSCCFTPNTSDSELTRQYSFSGWTKKICKWSISSIKLVMMLDYWWSLILCFCNFVGITNAAERQGIYGHLWFNVGL